MTTHGAFRYGRPDDELLPLLECVCGETFEPWEFTIGVYEDDPSECPACGRLLVFSQRIVIHEVEP